MAFYTSQSRASKSLKKVPEEAATGAALKSASAPVERVKILLQVQGMQVQMKVAVGREYDGILDAFRHILQEQGMLSFWRGNFINIVRYVPSQTMSFALHDLYKEVFMKGTDVPLVHLLAGNLAAGGGAGASTLTLFFPLDTARTKLTADLAKKKEDRIYKGIIDVLKKTYKAKGLPGLYKGFLISLQGIIVYRAIYFGVFDSITARQENPEKAAFAQRLMLAQMVTILAGLLSYPLDTIRRHAMVEEAHPVPKPRFVLTELLKSRPSKAFYRGAVLNTVRGFTAALMLALYDRPYDISDLD